MVHIRLNLTERPHVKLDDIRVLSEDSSNAAENRSFDKNTQLRYSGSMNVEQIPAYDLIHYDVRIRHCPFLVLKKQIFDQPKNIPVLIIKLKNL